MRSTKKPIDPNPVVMFSCSISFAPKSKLLVYQKKKSKFLDGMKVQKVMKSINIKHCWHLLNSDRTWFLGNGQKRAEDYDNEGPLETCHVVMPRRHSHVHVVEINWYITKILCFKLTLKWLV